METCRKLCEIMAEPDGKSPIPAMAHGSPWSVGGFCFGICEMTTVIVMIILLADRNYQELRVAGSFVVKATYLLEGSFHEHSCRRPLKALRTGANLILVRNTAKSGSAHHVYVMTCASKHRAWHMATHAAVC